MNRIRNKRFDYFGKIVDIEYSLTFDEELLDNIEIISVQPIDYMFPKDIEHIKTVFIQKIYREYNFKEEKQNAGN